MATQSKRRSDDDTHGDEQHRRQDAQARTAPQEHDEAGHESERGSAGRGSQSGGQGKGHANAQAGKRMLSRAARLLGEIESRIAELKEELEEQAGESGGSHRGSSHRGQHQAGQHQGEQGNGNGRSSHDGDDEDGEVQPGAQGRVKNPATDGRLKQNKDD